jgi:hypothetical protein
MERPTGAVFYQSADRQLLFMHPFNVRCLEHEFGQLSNCPQQLTAPVVEIEWETLSPESRKKYKYLSHVSLMCEIARVELDLSAILSPNTVKHFNKEFLQRKQARKQRESKELRHSRVMQRRTDDEARKMGFRTAGEERPAEMATELVNWLAPSRGWSDQQSAVGTPSDDGSSQPEGAVSSFLEAVGGYNGPAIMSNVEENPALSAAVGRAASAPAAALPIPVVGWGKTRVVPVNTGTGYAALPLPQVVLDPDPHDDYAPPSMQASFMQGLEARLGTLKDGDGADGQVDTKGKKRGKKKTLLLQLGGGGRKM